MIPRVPRQNRVTPFGDIVAVPERGLLMGNRGVLHDTEGHIARDSQVRRWIACRLEFRGRKRAIMQPNRYTELFFLDEATAFAAGHRPCAECRFDDYSRFRDRWPSALPPGGGSADALDRQLHAERRAGPWQKRTHTADLADLPDGAFIARDGDAWLVRGDHLQRCSARGYAGSVARPRRQKVTVLTPPSIVAVFCSGYEPAVHPTAG
jgi:hypothetical protein